MARKNGGKNMAANAVQLAANQEAINVRKSAFDIENFKTVKLEGKAVYTKLEKFEDLDSRIASLEMTKADNTPMSNEEKLVTLVNKALRRQFLFDQKELLGSDNPNLIGNKKVVNQFVNAFRQLPQWAKLEKDRSKQTNEILSFIRSNEVLLTQLKEAAKAANVSEEEGEETEEESTEETQTEVTQ